MAPLDEWDLYTSYTYIRDYHPWRGGQNPAFTRPNDGLVLDLKDGTENGIKRAADDFEKALGVFDPTTPTVLVIVPGHVAVASNVGRPMAQVVDLLVTRGRGRYIGGVDTLVRHTTIPKLATGGDRKVSVHVNSIAVQSTPDILENIVIVLDDVVTSGGSLLASRELLTRADAILVGALALGRTVE